MVRTAVVRYTAADLDEWAKARSFEMTSDYELTPKDERRNK